jgi:UDP-N-acetylmuramate dehydrogenase
LLSGIPGTLGGAIASNSGTRFGAIGSFVKRLRVLTLQGQILDLTNDQIHFDYRRTNLPEGCIILEADLFLETSVTDLLRRRRSKLLADRRAFQPTSERTAGCIFRNPSGGSAGTLIDKLGLKGMRVGGASVSFRHANFIVAGPRATGEDIYRLLHAVREKVAERFGVVLIPEVTIW